MPPESSAVSDPINDNAARIAVDQRRFPWIRRLAADYAFDFQAVAPFFSGNPSEPSAWTEAIRRAQAHIRRRNDVAALLADQQERRDAPPGVGTPAVFGAVFWYLAS